MRTVERPPESLLTAGAHLSVAFNKTSESSLLLSVAAPLTVKDMGMRGTLTFEPGLTCVSASRTQR